MDPAKTTRHLIAHLCALIVANLFLHAAFDKIGHNETRQFVIAIKNYHIVPDSYVNLMAIILPWWELGAANALIFPRTRRAGAILILAMLTMFISAVSFAALYKGYNIDCGCFGKHSAQAGWRTIGFDMGLVVATVLSVVLYAPGKCACSKPHSSSK